MRSGLLEAGRALVNVHRLRGTSTAVPVLLVHDPGLDVTAPAVDDSLDSPERARTAYHLAARTGAPELLARIAWPGGPAAEERALAAIEARDGVGFLAVLAEVLAPYGAAVPDPRVLVSLPALGLAARAVDGRIVAPDRLPQHPARPPACWRATGQPRGSGWT